MTAPHWVRVGARAPPREHAGPCPRIGHQRQQRAAEHRPVESRQLEVNSRLFKVLQVVSRELRSAQGITPPTVSCSQLSSALPARCTIRTRVSLVGVNVPWRSRVRYRRWPLKGAFPRRDQSKIRPLQPTGQHGCPHEGRQGRQGRLPKTSNFYCLPGRAGRSTNGLVVAADSQCPAAIRCSACSIMAFIWGAFKANTTFGSLDRREDLDMLLREPQ